jgi:hypothetical protein
MGLLAVAAIALFVLANQLGNPRTIEGYEALDEDTLFILTSGGDPCWTRTTTVEEAADAVRIIVKSYCAPGPMTAQAFPVHLIVDLERPLANRRVVDGSSIDGPAEVPEAR